MPAPTISHFPIPPFPDFSRFSTDPSRSLIPLKFPKKTWKQLRIRCFAEDAGKFLARETLQPASKAIALPSEAGLY